VRNAVSASSFRTVSLQTALKLDLSGKVHPNRGKHDDGFLRPPASEHGAKGKDRGATSHWRRGYQWAYRWEIGRLER
jgi:hypothetical protein